jgi:hypothetical protein
MSIFLDALNLEDGSDSLSRNVGDHLPTYYVQKFRRAKDSITQQQKTKFLIYLDAICCQVSAVWQLQTIVLLVCGLWLTHSY